MHFLRVFVAPAVLLATLSAAHADRPGDRGGSPGLGWAKGTPGPIAGAGLPVLVIAGAYLWVRKRRRARRALQDPTFRA
jgi:hypothetical protein